MSSGALGWPRPRVEERLATVTKPTGGGVRASGGSSDSRLSLGTSEADAKDPAPGRQARETTPRVPHPRSWAGVLLSQSPRWRRGSQLGLLLQSRVSPAPRTLDPNVRQVAGATSGRLLKPPGSSVHSSWITCDLLSQAGPALTAGDTAGDTQERLLSGTDLLV